MANPFIAASILFGFQYSFMGVAEKAVIRLGNSEFEVRQAAKQQLHVCGGYALPALRRAQSSPDRHIVSTSELLIDEITTKAINADILSPRYLSLSYRNASLEFILTDLSRKTGYTIGISVLTAEQLAKPLTIETNGAVPHWEAIQRVGDAIGMSPELTSQSRIGIGTLIHPLRDSSLFHLYGQHKAFLFDSAEPPRASPDFDAHLAHAEQSATEDLPTLVAESLKSSIMLRRREWTSPQFIAMGRLRRETVDSCEKHLQKLESLLPELEALAARSRACKFDSLNTDLEAAERAQRGLSAVQTAFREQYRSVLLTQHFWNYLRLGRVQNAPRILHFISRGVELGTADTHSSLRVSARPIPPELLAAVRTDSVPILLGVIAPSEFTALTLDSASVESLVDEVGNRIAGTRVPRLGNPLVIRDFTQYARSRLVPFSEAAFVSFPEDAQAWHVVTIPNARLITLPPPQMGTSYRQIRGTIAGRVFQRAESIVSVDLTTQTPAVGRLETRASVTSRRSGLDHLLTINLSYASSHLHLPIPGSADLAEMAYFRTISSSESEARIEVTDSEGRQYRVSLSGDMTVKPPTTDKRNNPVSNVSFQVRCRSNNLATSPPATFRIRGYVALPIQIPFTLNNVAVTPGTKPIEKPKAP